jgi:hypothetical protein
LELDEFELEEFELVDFELDEFEADVDFESDEALESEDDFESDPDDCVSLDVSLDDELSDLPDSADDPLLVLEDFARLSVLKNPEPLKLTPTGWKTFLTGITSPDSGCVNSESVSSLNDCWTSTVSPVSTNL